MRIKSIVSESKQIQRAIALIKLGARLQVLESETDLSYERLLRLYKEVQGESPARGMLPFSTDWFMTWQPNIHASLFLNMYEYLQKSTDIESIDAIDMIFDLEEKFDIEIPYNANSAQTDFGTVGDVVRAIEQVLARKAASA